MKTQRRHELQTNELADYLGNYLQSLLPYRYAIGLGALAILVAIGAALYMASQSRAQAAASWSAYFDAFAAADPTALEQVAEAHREAPAGLWARQLAGDYRLAEGSGLRLSDKKEAEKRLREAIQDFEAVAASTVDNPLLRNRALFGLAKAHESLCNLDKAEDYYRQVVQAVPTSMLGKAASQQLEELERAATKRWYGWFERQELAPPAPPAATDQGSGLPAGLGEAPGTAAGAPASGTTPAADASASPPPPAPESSPGPVLQPAESGVPAVPEAGQVPAKPAAAAVPEAAGEGAPPAAPPADPGAAQEDAAPPPAPAAVPAESDAPPAPAAPQPEPPSNE